MALGVLAENTAFSDIEKLINATGKNGPKPTFLMKEKDGIILMWDFCQANGEGGEK